MADAQNCRHIELPDTLWTRLRQAEEDVEHLLADKQTLAGVVTEQRLRAEAAEAALRLAQHLAVTFVEDGRQPVDCELTGFSGNGRCIEPAVAIRWEMGFADLVCEEHAQRARDRGALVVYPRRHDGTHIALDEGDPTS